MGPVGRAGRFLLGVYLLIVAVPYYLFPGVHLTFLGNTYFTDYPSLLIAIAITAGFLVFYLFFHYTASNYTPNLNRWVGAAIANVPPLAVFVVSPMLSFPPGEIASFTYVGAALLVAAWRKDGGCEVMAPANVILGKPAHFACIIFSPLDWAERRAK